MKCKRARQRTIADVTRQEWGILAEASIDLLAMARFVVWMYGADLDEDTSVVDCLDRMADVLEMIGLPQGTMQEYFANLEKVLTMPPEEFIVGLDERRAMQVKIARLHRLERRGGKHGAPDR